MPLEGKAKAEYMRLYMALKRAGLDPVKEMARLKAKEEARRARKAAETEAGSNKPAFPGAGKETEPRAAEPATKPDRPVTKHDDDDAGPQRQLIDLAGDSVFSWRLPRGEFASRLLLFALIVLDDAGDPDIWPPIERREQQALAARLDLVIAEVEALFHEFDGHEEAAKDAAADADHPPEK